MTALRDYRLSAGLTQARLAAKSFLSQGHIHKMETGQVKPWEREAQAISVVLGIPPETLFPDGYKVRCDYGHLAVDPPPDVPRNVRRYPRSFSVMCWHCRSIVSMKTDDYHPVVDTSPACPLCGAEFRDIVPLEEAARP
jgi:DNA-binding XRE family transcriptional regulator